MGDAGRGLPDALSAVGFRYEDAEFGPVVVAHWVGRNGAVCEVEQSLHGLHANRGHVAGLAAVAAGSALARMARDDGLAPVGVTVDESTIQRANFVGTPIVVVRDGVINAIGEAFWSGELTITGYPDGWAR